MRRLWMISLKGDRSPITIFNRKARVTDGQSSKPRATGIPNIHLSFAGFIIIGWAVFWKLGLRIGY